MYVVRLYVRYVRYMAALNLFNLFVQATGRGPCAASLKQVPPRMRALSAVADDSGPVQHVRLPPFCTATFVLANIVPANILARRTGPQPGTPTLRARHRARRLAGPVRYAQSRWPAGRGSWTIRQDLARRRLSARRLRKSWQGAPRCHDRLPTRTPVGSNGEARRGLFCGAQRFFLP